MFNKFNYKIYFSFTNTSNLSTFREESSSSETWTSTHGRYCKYPRTCTKRGGKAYDRLNPLTANAVIEERREEKERWEREREREIFHNFLGQRPLHFWTLIFLQGDPQISRRPLLSRVSASRTRHRLLFKENGNAFTAARRFTVCFTSSSWAAGIALHTARFRHSVGYSR